MDSEIQPAKSSKAMTITGWIIGGLPCLMLFFSAYMKFAKPPGMEEGLAHLGWSMDLMTNLGILEAACAIVYLIPRTAVLGAILLTGYMGGAIATHVRVGDPVFIHIGLGILFWLGIWLRDPRLRKLLPLR